MAQLRPEGWESALLNPHSMNAYVDLFYSTDMGTLIHNRLSVESGSVTIDMDAQIRRQCQFTVVDADDLFADLVEGRLTPGDDGSGVLTPYGVIANIGYQLSFPNLDYGDDDLYDFTLGSFWVSDVEVTGDGELSVSGYDYAWQVARAKYSSPYIIPAGTLVTDAVILGLTDRLPPELLFVNNIGTSTEVTPLVTIDSDPWDAYQQLAANIGYELYFDFAGYLAIVPKDDPTALPVSYELLDGVHGIVSRRRVLSADPGYNGVVGTNEAATIVAPLRSVAWDTNPSSPTYYLGRYGQVPMYKSYPYAATQAALDAAVAADLVRQLGNTEPLELSVVPDPTKEVEDVFRYASARLGVDGLYQIRRITIPLTPEDAMSISATRIRPVTG